MTERGLPLADGASACPFVAFEDDRDERASVPDHRHRCYAETRPAPRALAHQEAYCLSTAFPVCPTFQDWARREAARARDAADAASASARRASAAGTDEVAASAAGVGAAAGAAAVGTAATNAAGPGDGSNDDAPDEAGGLSRRSEEGFESAAAGSAAGPGRDGSDTDEPEREDPDADDFGARRNPPRDWAAPPPWLASDEGRRAGSNAGAPPFLSNRASDPGQGLAGSAADRLAGGSPGPSSAAAGYGAAATGGAAAAGLAASASPTDHGERHRDGDGDRAQDDHADDGLPRRTRRPRAYEQHLGGTDGPDWEQPRRYEAYPRIRTRVGLPNVPRLGVMAGAIAIAAIALFLLPFVLGFGSSPGPAASLGPSAGAASASAAITPVPAATPTIYTIKKGDTLLRIAKANGISLDQLLHANPAIKDPNRVQLGQQIIIPTPSGASGDGSPSASP